MCMQELWLVKLLVINELVCVYIRDTASIGTIKNSNKNQDYTYWIEPIKLWTTIYKGQFGELKQMARFAFTDYYCDLEMFNTVHENEHWGVNLFLVNDTCVPFYCNNTKYSKYLSDEDFDEILCSNWLSLNIFCLVPELFI